MVAGDEKYRMVEDEFLQTARQFTTHLHRAEYNRLKMRAEAQNADAIRDIQRPVVPGLPTALARYRKEASKRVSKQREALGKDAAAAAADDLPWVGTSLQGLMETPRGEERRIAAAGTGDGKTTRAAAGFTPVREAGNLSRRPVVTPTRQVLREDSQGGLLPPLGASSSTGLLLSSVSRTRRAFDTERSSAVDESPFAHLNEVRERQAADDEADDDPFGVGRRRVQRVQSRGSLRRPLEDNPTPKALSPDTIPSFL
ncbi:hypothetical protein AAL_01494 [Moelleriella libera RCEF 2490]|uniref:Uncharacterized protein n=1 Tax=Moelleriella libera RCEF 2490 TaxID=1081109 RepID=A0A166U7R4_9HYPO|nr:hypothetical protein AAL_01494 [Moelleriella libera RCEF 2490]